MVKITVEKNDAGQRLDKFLKKYLAKAPLSHIYRIIRKDLKVNGKRGKEDTLLNEGDELTFYIPDEEFTAFTEKKKSPKAKKQFTVVYEDANILIVDKPVGLLTHGDVSEKKNTLANQVTDYLIEKGDYVPRIEKTFKPAAANRLDRNTSGLVIFGKNHEALKSLNEMTSDKDSLSKIYMAVVSGIIDKEVHLKSKMKKDHEKNMVKVLALENEGKYMETIVSPVKSNGKYTLVEVKILTGRTHQIRAHLASIGHPIVGDVKYGGAKLNAKNAWQSAPADSEAIAAKGVATKGAAAKGVATKGAAAKGADAKGATTQLLHAHKLIFNRCPEGLKYMEGKEICAPLPENFEAISKK